MSTQQQVCPKLGKGCVDSESCQLFHPCRYYYFRGKCQKGKRCKFSHDVTLNTSNPTDPTLTDQSKHVHTDQAKKKRVKNTECFEPSHRRADMRVIVGTKVGLDQKIKPHDVVLVNDLFSDYQPGALYDRLMRDFEGVPEKIKSGLWKSWHGSSHQIADDKLGWKKHCPTFSVIIKQLEKYFKMEVKATRFNWYRDSSEWKPYHHDAAAVKKERSETQNFTVGVSFGLEREASFQHAKTKTEVNFPLRDGSVYAFARDTNVIWKHGIPQIPPEKESDQGRISIIAWGWIELDE